MTTCTRCGKRQGASWTWDGKGESYPICDPCRNVWFYNAETPGLIWRDENTLEMSVSEELAQKMWRMWCKGELP